MLRDIVSTTKRKKLRLPLSHSPCMVHVWDVKANHLTCWMFHPAQQVYDLLDSARKIKLQVPAGLFDISIDKQVIQVLARQFTG